MKSAMAEGQTEIAMFLRGALAQAGLDVSEGASAVGFSRSKLSAILNGNQKPTISDVYVFAYQLGRRDGKAVTR